LSGLWHHCKASIGQDEDKGSRGRPEEREGRAAVLYIPLSLQAAELGSAGHASPPAWSLPVSGSDWCSRTEEGGAHRKRGTEVRSGTTAVDKSRKREVKEYSACWNIRTSPCNRTY